VKFNLTAAIDGEERLQRMRENLRRDIPRLKPQPARKDVLAICGYGPSLKHTWREISTPFVCTTSGAHDFLIERGIIPTFHVEYDPRPHKAKFLEKPHAETTYCISSVCNANMFDQLRNSKVLLWHALGGQDRKDCEVIDEVEEDGIVLFGGSTAGLRALAVGHTLGFHHFELHGMDCSYEPGSSWAGAHPSPQHPTKEVECNGRKFLTSELMINAAEEMATFITQRAAICRFNIHGDNLFAERMKLLIKDNWQTKRKWWEPVGWKPIAVIAGVPQSDDVISEDYRETLRWLHEVDPNYGANYSHVNAVSLFMRATGSEDVLDYGCGKGALAKALKKPIKQYDPAIAGKDQPPEPADLVVCANVLHQVEFASLDAVLSDIARLTRRIAYFEISERAPNEGWIAEIAPAHPPMDGKWWTDLLGEHFEFLGPVVGGMGSLRAACVPRLD